MAGSKYFIPCLGDIQVGITGGIFTRWCTLYSREVEYRMKKNEGRILPFIDMEHVPTKNYMCGGEGEEITRIHPFDLYLYFLGERLDEEIRKWGFHDLRTFVSMGILSALPSDASQRHPRS